jgi:hypothetical protein
MFRIKSSLIVPGVFLVFFGASAPPSFGQSTKPVADVKVVNTPTVTVGNTAANPVLTRDANERAITPFETELGASFLNGAQFSEEMDIAVPAGKRLVIEFMSAQVRIPTGQFVTGEFATTVGGLSAVHYLAMTPQGKFGGGDIFALSQPMEVSADPNTPVRIHMFRSDVTGQGFVQLSVSGYLVDAQ